MSASLQILKLEVWGCVESRSSVEAPGVGRRPREARRGIAFPVEPRPRPQLCTQLQSRPSLGPWRTSLTQCRNTCGFFCNLCNLPTGITRRWLHVFLLLQTRWGVTANVPGRDGGFVLRSKRVGERRWNALLNVVRSRRHAGSCVEAQPSCLVNWLRPWKRHLGTEFCQIAISVQKREIWGVVVREQNLKTTSR